MTNDRLQSIYAWVTTMLGRPFQWGENDCAMICFEAVDRVRGRASVASQYIGKWNTARAAITYQRRNATDLEVALKKEGVFRFNGPPVAGDLVLHPHPKLPFICGHVCLGESVISSNEENGVYLGKTASALEQPGSFVMRIA